MLDIEFERRVIDIIINKKTQRMMNADMAQGLTERFLTKQFELKSEN